MRRNALQGTNWVPSTPIHFCLEKDVFSQVWPIVHMYPEWRFLKTPAFRLRDVWTNENGGFRIR